MKMQIGRYSSYSLLLDDRVNLWSEWKLELDQILRLDDGGLIFLNYLYDVFFALNVEFGLGHITVETATNLKLRGLWKFDCKITKKNIFKFDIIKSTY